MELEIGLTFLLLHPCTYLGDAAVSADAPGRRESHTEPDHITPFPFPVWEMGLSLAVQGSCCSCPPGAAGVPAQDVTRRCLFLRCILCLVDELCEDHASA